METIVNFISGHLDLSQSEFEIHYKPKIDEALIRNEGFVVGDAKGADTLTQNYLLGKTDFVMVYHMFESPRYNVGFPAVGDFATDSHRDEQMTNDSNCDIAWVRPGRDNSGTQRNLDRRLAKQNK